MKENEVIIAIDPDCEKSGVAMLYANKQFELQSLEFPKLIDFIQLKKNFFDFAPLNLIVIVEAGWLNQSNWHVNRGQSNRVAASIGNKTGRNHEAGRKIIECLRYLDIDVREVRPLKKCWKGREGKITHEELSYFVPGLPSRTSQDVRDALLLAWNYAGFSIRVAPIKTKITNK
jgi:hypothetical protein